MDNFENGGPRASFLVDNEDIVVQFNYRFSKLSRLPRDTAIASLKMFAPDVVTIDLDGIKLRDLTALANIWDAGRVTGIHIYATWTCHPIFTDDAIPVLLRILRSPRTGQKLLTVDRNSLRHGIGPLFEDVVFDYVDFDQVDEIKGSALPRCRKLKTHLGATLTLSGTDSCTRSLEEIDFGSPEHVIKVQLCETHRDARNH